jgi:hypothetical protein
MAFLFIVSFNSIGQVDKIKNFSYLKSSGNIPEEFLKLTSDKYKEDYSSNEDKGLDKDFFLSTRYFIDELLLSGNILFNEELSNYVNKVAKYTLRKEKSLYKELQFYVLKSNSVNAFSTDQGIIFVTTGLLAQLENEAQLAYILAHEVAHYTEKHAREGYVERQNIKNGKGKYSRLSYEDKVGELSVYSKDNEHEADSKGIEIFLESEYDIETVFTSFEVLLYAYLPFEDIKFDSTFFNTDILFIPGEMFPDSINQISKEEDFNDHLSSHPNVLKRMDKSFDVIGDRESRGNLKFKISETTFATVRTLARLESINISLANRQYVDAIYSIYLLKRKISDNKFLDFSLAKALYGLAKYKNHFRYNEVILKPKKTEGELYALAYFFKNINKAQLNVLAYRSAYDLSQKYPTDKIMKNYERDMLKELALFSKIDADDLVDVDYKTYNDSITNVLTSFNIEDSLASIDANNDLSKYKKIKLKKSLYSLQDKSTISITAEQFHLTGLSDIVRKGEMKKEMKDFISEPEEVGPISSKKFEKEKGLGIKKLVVVDPYLADYNGDNKKDNLKSEKTKIELNKMYTQSHSDLELEILLVDSKSLLKSDVQKYNEIGLLYQWVSEILEHDEIEMISNSNKDIQLLMKKYGTEHFMFSGIIKYRKRKQHNFENFAFVINTATDKVEYSQVSEINLRASKYVMEAYIYNLLYNLNRQ